MEPTESRLAEPVDGDRWAHGNSVHQSFDEVEFHPGVEVPEAVQSGKCHPRSHRPLNDEWGEPASKELQAKKASLCAKVDRLIVNCERGGVRRSCRQRYDGKFRHVHTNPPH